MAGAAEGILSGLLPTESLNTMNQIADEALEEINKDKLPEEKIEKKDFLNKHMNFTKNGFKHVVEGICEQKLNIKFDAYLLLIRVLVDFKKLDKPISRFMFEFVESHSEEDLINLANKADL